MTYQILRSEIESDVKSTQDKLNGIPCPVDCFHCCMDVATMTRISAVEAKYLEIGLRQLDVDTRQHIYETAVATIQLLESKGWTQEMIAEDGGVAALKDISGNAKCPMLMEGKCSVYEHRPMVCRAWGYPLKMYGEDEIRCCEKTIITDDKDFYKPIYYPYFEDQCNTLSQEIEDSETIDHIPNVYLVKILIECMQSPAADIKQYL